MGATVRSKMYAYPVDAVCPGVPPTGLTVTDEAVKPATLKRISGAVTSMSATRASAR